MNMNVASIIALVLLSGCGPPAVAVVVDGGWKGTYECGADSKKASAALAQDAEGNVGGEMFLDYQIVVLGTPLLLTGRADVSGLRTDADLDADVDVLDNSQGMPDWQIDVTMNDAADELDGVIENVDGEGNPVGSCDLHLERTSP